MYVCIIPDPDFYSLKKRWRERERNQRSGREMGSMNPSDLILDCSKTWVPKTIEHFLAEVSRVETPSEKISKLDDYINRLQDEMKKIDAFKRELPLCMLLINDAILMMNDELILYKKSRVEPVLEEFIPLKNSTSTDEKDEKDEDSKETDVINTKDKMSWMSSVQLWNPENQQNHYPNSDLSNEKSVSKLDDNRKRMEDENGSVMNNLFQTGVSRTGGRAFVPFKGCASFPMISVGKEERDEFPGGVPGLTLRMPEIKNSVDEINSSGFRSKSCSSRSGSSSATNGQSNFKSGQQQIARKQRRCWSPELHRRFVNALHQLGGAQAATPKQIRELMQVDGLTNDEVKSHLQKYRLHSRRTPSTTNTSDTQPLALGGLWMSQEQGAESSKPCNSQSGSPQGPLHLPRSSQGTSMTGGESMEDEDDEKYESHSWKRRIHLSGRDDV